MSSLKLNKSTSLPLMHQNHDCNPHPPPQLHHLCFSNDRPPSTVLLLNVEQCEVPGCRLPSLKKDKVAENSDDVATWQLQQERSRLTISPPDRWLPSQAVKTTRVSSIASNVVQARSSCNSSFLIKSRQRKHWWP